MNAQEKLYQAVLASNPDDTEGARQVADILLAFAEVLRGPAPEVQGVELVADDTPALILAELRAVRELMEVSRRSALVTCSALDR